MEICVQTMTGYDRTLELARWCEANAVPALALADHYLSGFDTSSEGYDQLVVLGGITRETSTIELCTLVSPLTFRHPAVHVKAGVTLDQMSSGRFSLGIGTGWMELEHASFGLELYPMAERFARLEESLAYIRAAIDGSGEGFAGRYYRLAAFDPQPRPHNLRIIVGGSGARRTPELAGRYADELNVFPGDVPMSARVAAFRSEARAAGRDPFALGVSTAFPSFVSSDAADAGRMMSERAERMKADVDEAAASLDRLGIPHGTPEEAKASYAALAEAGVGRVFLQMSRSSLEEIARAVEGARATVAAIG